MAPSVMYEYLMSMPMSSSQPVRSLPIFWPCGGASQAKSRSVIGLPCLSRSSPPLVS